MAWFSRVRISCAHRTWTAKFRGPSSGEALRKGLNFNPGPGCKKEGVIEMIRRGSGESLSGPKRKKRRKGRR